MGSRSALIYYLIKEFLVLVAYFRIFLVVLLQDMATLKLTDRSLPDGVRWVRIMSLCSQTLISSTLSPKESNLCHKSAFQNNRIHWRCHRVFVCDMCQ